MNKSLFSTVAAIATLVLFAGCETMPGSSKETTSILDGTREVHVEPGWIRTGKLMADIKLGGFWSTKSPDDFVLEPVVLHGESITDLKVGIDGKIHELNPTDATTQLNYKPGTYNSVARMPGQLSASRQFRVPLTFIDEMIAGTNVVVQINGSRGYREGIFSFDQPTYARPAFRKAVAKIRASAPSK